MRRRDLGFVMALLAGALALGAYVIAQRNVCDDDGRAMRGEVKRTESGKLLYFDGRCWSTKPMPPMDTPF